MPLLSPEAHGALVALSKVDGRVETEGRKILAQLRRDVVEEVLAALKYDPSEPGYADFGDKLMDVTAARSHYHDAALIAFEILDVKGLESRAAKAAKAFSADSQEAAA